MRTVNFFQVLLLTGLLFILGAITGVQAIHWRDCGSTMVQVQSCVIYPVPQVAFQNWTLNYTVVNKIDFDESLNATLNVIVSLDGIPLHTEAINFCSPGPNPIARGDGFGRCPYVAGTEYSFHDTNLVPLAGTFHTLITATAPGYPGNLMCLEFNQTIIW